MWPCWHWVVLTRDLSLWVCFFVWNTDDLKSVILLLLLFNKKKINVKSTEVCTMIAEKSTV